MDHEMGKIVEKVWGEEQYIVNTEKYCGKLLHIKPGYVCSDHRHLVKDETFYVLAGHGAIMIDGAVRSVKVGDTIRITPGTWHCFATAGGMTLLEISTNHQDEDVQRLSESHELSWGDDDDCSMLRESGAIVPEVAGVRLGRNSE